MFRGATMCCNKRRISVCSYVAISQHWLKELLITLLIKGDRTYLPRCLSLALSCWSDNVPWSNLQEGDRHTHTHTKTEDLILPRWTQPGEMVSRRCGWRVDRLEASPHGFVWVHILVYKECQVWAGQQKKIAKKNHSTKLLECKIL